MSHSTLPRTSRYGIVGLPSGTTLEYTYIQTTSPSSTQVEEQRTVTRLAICLHPWSWLGGCMDDPVLQLMTEPLLEGGYDVIRYNSRGVGKSTGRASLTGHREGEDLKELVQWARSTMPHITSFVLAGYSHGSLIASLHPLLDDLKVSHVLLSYPLGPRQWLTAFHGHRYITALESLVSDTRSNVLVIYGDNDSFTSENSYDTWAKSLRHACVASEPSRLHVVKVEGASHFWREVDGVYRLLKDWLPSTVV